MDLGFIKITFNIPDIVIHFKISLYKKEIYIKFLPKRDVNKLQEYEQKTSSENKEKYLFVGKAFEKKYEPYK